MAFEVLEKSPKVAPLLVRLYDTHNLYSLAENKANEGACFELSTIMVDLLSINLSEKESELITDVLLALMKQAEKDLKVALAEQLSGMDSVPLRMILALANEEIEIADSILRASPLLEDLDLAYILQSRGVTHGRSIATRRGLSGAIIDMLANTKDFEIAVNLSNNDGVSLTQHAFKIFADMARNNEVLARPLLSRDDVPQEVVGALYEFVGAELKKILTERFGIGAKVANEVLEDIVLELRDPDSLRHETTDILMTAAHHAMARGELRISTVIGSLRRGQYATFMTQIATLFALPLDTVKAMMRQETGRGLALACRAKDVTKADFVSLYLLTEKFRAHGKKMVSHTELTRIMTMYDTIDPEDAREIMKNSRH